MPISWVIFFSMVGGFELLGDIYRTNGTLYDQKTKKSLFTYARERQTRKNNTQVKSTFYDLKKSVVLVEEYLYQNNKLLTLSIDKRQTGEKGKVEFSKKKIKFSYTFANGNTEKDEEDLEKNTLVADQLAPFMQSHWAELLKGETLKIRYIVPHRTETVGFKIFMEGKSKCENGSPSITMKMKASSIFIAAIVDPIYFKLEAAEGHRICEYTGRVPVSRRVKGKWKDFDARTVYDKTQVIKKTSR